MTGGRALLLVFAHSLALWPVGAWMVRRSTEGGGEAWGLAAAAAAVGALLVRPRAMGTSSPPRLLLPITLLAASAAAWRVLPPLFAAALGVLSLASLAGELRLRRRFDVATCGLALLALPDISTLQVFLGWPFRVGVASVVAGVLRATTGVAAAQQGTLVVVEGHAVAIDAPCSGVWMGWGALIVWLVLAGMRDLRPRTVLLGLALLGPSVFVANALRSLCLTWIELRPAVPGWVHEGVGLVVFALLAAALVAGSERLAGRDRRWRATCA